IIPNQINSYDELINVLKSHSSFNFFKESCKLKLQTMKYVPEKEENYISTFIAKFRSLCYDAEINNDPEEIKTLLYNMYSSNEFFKNEFLKRINRINLVDEIIKVFGDVVLDKSRTIKYGSLVTLKHVATGKYLSSQSLRYETGSRNQVVCIPSLFHSIILIILSN